MPQYVIRRNKKDDSVVFGGAARALGKEAVGSVTAKMSSSGNANNLDLCQTSTEEDTGVEYKLLYNIPFSDFRTRTWNGDKTTLSSKVSYGTTTAAIIGINQVTEFQTTDLAVGNVGIGTTRADNVILNFGNDNDLKIWHDGNDSNIADVGTGNLHIASQDFTTFYNPSKTIKRAVFGDYNCSFFYGSQERVKVVGFGVTVTGGIYATGIITASAFSGDGSNITGISTLNITNYGVGLGGGGGSGGGSIAGIDTTGTSTFNIISANSYTGIAYTMLSGIPTAPLTVNEFNYYQQYETPGGGSATAGPRIYTVEPDYNKNPFYYGTQLKPGQEMRWTQHSDASDEKYGLGMWGGSTSYTPSNGFHTSLWSRIARFDHDIVDFGTGSFDSKGFTPSAGANVNYPISTSTELALAYNEYTNKLEVHNVTGTREVIATSSTAEDGNPVSISFAISQNGALPGITTVTDYEYPDTWYVGFGTLSNTVVASPFADGNTRDLHPVKWANYLEKGFEYRFTSLNTSSVDHFYTIGLWNGDTDAPDQSQSYHDTHWSLMFSLGTTGSVNTLNPSSSDTYNGSSAQHSSKNTTVSSGSSVTFNKGDILCLNWSPTDSKLRLINETNNYVAIGTATQANSEDALQIYMGGKNAPVAQPVFVKRDQSWEMIAYRYDTGANPAKGWNWRKDGGDRPFVNMSSTRDLLPGQKVQIRIPRQGFNHYYWIAAGGWQGPTGQTEDMSSSDHVDAGSDVYWRWDSGEDTNVTDGWDYNTSNSKYDSGGNNWDPGNSYEHVIEYRYRTSDNKIQWWDVTPDNASAPERIATTSNSLGGGAVRFGIMSIQNDVRTSGTYVDLKELTYLLL